MAACGLLAALATAAALAAGGGGGGAVAAASTTPPNVLIIVTDDQRLNGTMDVMPDTVQRFETEGTKFTRAFATNPGCCPSRSSIFSGRYVHNHGVVNNDVAVNLDQRYTMQRYLKQAGYRTGVFGKYFNAWNLLNNPANFDKWAIQVSGYTPFRANEQGVVKTITQYATSYIRDNAVTFLQQSEADDAQPWFLYLAPTAPHSPFTPDTPYASASVPPFQPNPATDEADRSDKPAYLQAQQDDLTTALNHRVQQLRTLMSVDDMVDTVFQTLDANGETQDTLAIFVSDNGFYWGEHKLEEKGEPYYDAIAVPLSMRWPGHVAAGAVDGRLAANIDLAPTVMEATGVSPDIPMDGRSLLDPVQQRSRMLTEFSGGSLTPSWASLWTPGSHYIEYYDDAGKDQRVRDREYYDLTSDPYELSNLLNDGNTSNDPEVAPLSAQLAEDRFCTGASCP